MNRHGYSWSLVLLGWALLMGAGPVNAGEAPFQHPGLMHTRSDLQRMKEKVRAGQDPWAAGFQVLKAHPQSSSQWKPRGPFETVSRGAGIENVHRTELDLDAGAAYQNALMWSVTGEDVHARKAAEILDRWAGTLKQLRGHDVQLVAGFDGFKLANAAELLRYTWPGWDSQKTARCSGMLTNVFLPKVKDFATFANGNWDGACMKAVMAIAIFCDDRAQYERVMEYYGHGQGNGSLTHYVFNDAGQCQESGRDQAHTQLGLGQLAEVCQMAWNQGRDLLGAENNRLLKGFEYTAKYNLGEPVAFIPHVDQTGRYRAREISSQSRGRLRPIYEMVWNHYHVRQGLPAPYTQRAAERLRPEGAAPFSDHVGFGTLLFSLRPADEAQGTQAVPQR